MIKEIRELLDPFTRIGINKLDGQILGMFIHAADGVLELLKTQPVPRDEAYALLTYSHIYANVVAVTPYKTTDQWLGLFKDPAKIMFLYTGRNKRPPPGCINFFDYDVELASLWFAQYVLPVIGCTDITMQANLESHYRYMDPRCIFLPQSTHAYFWSDYFDSQVTRGVKTQFNKSIKLPALDNVPNPKHIAIVTGNWKPTHAVVKVVGKIAYALADKYTLTLVHLGPVDPQADLSPFKSVVQVALSDGLLDLSELQATTFGTAIFLDIGLTPESIYLSNMRLAPVQITCHGHPVSGQLNQIDYILTGGLVEKTGQRYSETPVILPGSGVLPALPSYQRLQPLLKAPVRVAVPWSAIKYNQPMFHCLKCLQQSGAHLVFMPGSPIHRYQASIPVRMAMLDYFGKDITIVPNLPYTKYLEVLESCHFAVDSYPFGGYNTVIEALWCGLPVVTLEGNEWRNRAASYLLHRAGLSELVTLSAEAYFEAARMLILDNNYCDKMRHKVNAIDFGHLIGADCVADFTFAISRLIQSYFGDSNE